MTPAGTVTGDAEQGSVLSFDVDGEICGVDMSAIVEVVEYQEVTRVPFAPPHVLGVFNLRGSVLPVVNLASRLGLQRAVPTRRATIVVVHSLVSGELVRVGLLAESVRTVVSYGLANLEPAPQIGARISPELLRGLVGDADGFVFVLDLEKTLSLVGEMSSAAAPKGAQSNGGSGARDPRQGVENTENAERS